MSHCFTRPSSPCVIRSEKVLLLTQSPVTEEPSLRLTITWFYLFRTTVIRKPRSSGESEISSRVLRENPKECGYGCCSNQLRRGQQQWRAPLREVLDWLRDRLSGIFEQKMAPFRNDTTGHGIGGKLGHHSHTGSVGAGGGRPHESASEDHG